VHNVDLKGIILFPAFSNNGSASHYRCQIMLLDTL